MSTHTAAHTSERYREAVQAIIAADLAFWTASLREAATLMPHTANALVFRVNDTPRLAFDAYLDQDGEEHEAEEIDDAAYAVGLFDAIDEAAIGSTPMKPTPAAHAGTIPASSAELPARGCTTTSA